MYAPLLSPAVAFSFFYWLVAFCFVVAPTEFQSSGVTIQSLFASWLGSESIDFVNYHIKRTTATTLFHASLPLGYFIGMTFVGESGLEFFELSEWAIHTGWQIYFYTACSLFIGCATLVYYWHMNEWSNHPIAKNLSLYCESWRTGLLEINAEFRSIDKYTSGPSGTSRTIVVDNWIIKTGAYSVKFVHQDHVVLSVGKTEEYQVSPDTMTTVQYVRINVNPLKPQSGFSVRILSTEYSDFKAKLRTEIYTLPNVTIHQTSGELFLSAFRDQVEQNPLYVVDSGLTFGSCIGCHDKAANVKLTKQCAEPDDGDCKSCQCPPMWCLECMGRWYASRQDQARPESWLGGFATCPMCRSRFCMLDVSAIHHT
nr:E3 ubiquitin-protein ligase TM129 [Ciona intestinalis]|eukprot:XP_002127608.1 E3 ubiquitin-protein ligase TM129 [Ciona intestinalis]